MAHESDKGRIHAISGGSVRPPATEKETSRERPTTHPETDFMTTVRSLEDTGALYESGLSQAIRCPWASHMKTLLSTLLDELDFHFEYEESGHLYTSLPEEFPRFARELDQLRKQHCELSAAFSACLVGLDDPSPSIVLPALAQLRAAIRCLKEHEAEETRILQMAYSQDIGAMD